MNNDEIKSKKKKYIIVICLGIILLVGGVSLALWTTTTHQKDENTLTATCLDIDYEDINEGINLENLEPTNIENGLNQEGYTFKITNNCDQIVAIDINLESLTEVPDESRASIDYLDAVVTDTNMMAYTAKTLNNYDKATTLLTEGESYDTRLIDSTFVMPNSSREFNLKIWLDYSAPNSEMNKLHNSKITINGYFNPNVVYNMKFTDFISNLVGKSINSELRLDETEDHNLRYIGKNPNNYVDFGDGQYDTDVWYGFDGVSYTSGVKQFPNEQECEDDLKYNKRCTKMHSQGDPILWRIIGVMNNVEDGSGNKNTRIKLIRADGIGQISWDRRCDELRSEDEPGHCIQSPDYYNNWAESSLQKLLNTAYLNSAKSNEYNRISWYTKGFSDINLKYEKIDFTNKGIKSEYRNMIDTVKYNLGGPDRSSSKENYYGNLTSNLFYNIERSDYVYPGNQKEWIGQIGLMYPSDYGFATAGGVGLETRSNKQYTTPLETCMSVPLDDWYYYDENVGCRDNDWLYQGEGAFQWTISPFTSFSDYVTYINDGGGVDYGVTHHTYLVHPVLYLKPDIKIISGTGTKENPFKIGLGG